MDRDEHAHTSATLCLGGQPLQCEIDVYHVLAGDAVSAHLARLRVTKVSMRCGDTHGAPPSELPRRTCASICRSMRSISSRSLRAPGRSFLFPRTSSGMPASALSLPSCGFSRLCSSLRARSMVPWSAASTTKLGRWEACKGGETGVGGFRTAKKPWSLGHAHNSVHASAISFPHAAEARLAAQVPQLRSTESGQHAWHASAAARFHVAHGRKHTLMATLPLVTLRMLKPTVGIMSSLKEPVCSPQAQRPGERSALWRAQRRVFDTDTATCTRAPSRQSPGGRAPTVHPSSPRDAPQLRSPATSCQPR